MSPHSDPLSPGNERLKAGNSVTWLQNHKEDALLLEGDLGMEVLSIFVCSLPTIHCLFLFWSRVSEVQALHAPVFCRPVV